MSRTRKNPADNWMPPRVYKTGISYFFYPSSGGAIKLCSASEKQSVVWEKYELLLGDKTLLYTVAIMIRNFFNSAEYKSLSFHTQSDYRKNSRCLLQVFGKMEADNVKPQHVRAYMDKRGLRSRVQANREKAFFSRTYAWAYERGFVKGNPCKGVRQYSEKARTRYITDEEYKMVYDVAAPSIRLAMELSYLCAARKSDVVTMRWDQILEDGIFIQQHKTGIRQIKLWSPRLIKAIHAARDQSDREDRLYVVVKADGHPYSSNGFDSAWQRTMKKAREVSGFPLDFTFHDIKAKAISDIDGSSKVKQAISGHKTELQVATYDRSVKRVPAIDSVKISGEPSK